MFDSKTILYEDNHLLIVNKKAGQLVQSDNSGDSSLENDLKEFIKCRDAKPGAVFLGVVHRIDRPVSGVVIFAKTSKALTRMCEKVKKREIKKIYWAIIESKPFPLTGELVHYIERNPKKNRSYAYDAPRKNAKEARLNYRYLLSGTHYHLLEINLITGRHHQIRCQLSKAGFPIKGDLKYGASRSNENGSISLHAREIAFTHPVTKANVRIVAPVPGQDNLWLFFESHQSNQ